MEISVTVRCNVECSISVKQKDATSTTENYGPYTKPGRREKMHTEFVGSQLRTKCNSGIIEGRIIEKEFADCGKWMLFFKNIPDKYERRLLHRMVCLVTYWCRTCSAHRELRNM